MLCEEEGIPRQLTIPSTLQQKSVAERMNLTLLNMVRSMMVQVNISILIGEMYFLTVYIFNRVPSKSILFTPYELWTGKKSNLGNMRPWGSTTFFHNTSHGYGKSSPRGKKKGVSL